MNRTALLLFPPNWSACVTGPHLALPLLAETGRRLGWDVECWDLSEEFYRAHAEAPVAEAIAHAAHGEAYELLDSAYFSWEDKLREIQEQGYGDRSRFGLLTGYPFPELESANLAEVVKLLLHGTVYSRFIEVVIQRIVDHNPSVIGVTLASEHQVVPAVELMQKLRTSLPNALLVLGGNVVTRLRQTTAFEVLSSLCDSIVVFQGERAFAELLSRIDACGIRDARESSAKIAGDESIPIEDWPVPSFRGIAIATRPGIPALPYVSTRGCYWGRCHFCAIPAGWSATGYSGSAPPEMVVDQIMQMVRDTGVPRMKFVDEAIVPTKARDIGKILAQRDVSVEWEAYARLDKKWEDPELLSVARKGGLRKLYFGLEQSPTTNRNILNKKDNGNPLRIMTHCNALGIKVHLFCMVGHPGSSARDAMTTTEYLIDNQHLIDTADLVAFRLDRGTTVPGVEPQMDLSTDWAMSLPYRPKNDDALEPEAVVELEESCQERLWESAPRLLHPLYRLLSPWHA